MRARVVMLLSMLVLNVMAAGVVSAQTPEMATPAGTPATPIGATPAGATPAATDLNGLRAYMVGNVDAMKGGTSALLTFAQAYYGQARAVSFDYQRLWDEQAPTLVTQLDDARTAWSEEAHGHYELNEGLVAGIPSLTHFDVLIDAGPSGADDPTNAPNTSLTLPDGRVLDRPGNLFHMVTEPTLWGTIDDFVGLRVDMNGDGQITLGEALPDANVLLAGMQALDDATSQLQTAIDGWTPNLQDTFTALVVMIPTMQGYFNDWKLSPSVLGAASTETGFVANSRLVDVLGILGGLDVAYNVVQQDVAGVSPEMAAQIRASLDAMVSFVQNVRSQEVAGTLFTPEQADYLGQQLQAQADDVAGQITQAAALLGITIQSS